MWPCAPRVTDASMPRTAAMEVSGWQTRRASLGPAKSLTLRPHEATMAMRLDASSALVGQGVNHCNTFGHAAAVTADFRQPSNVHSIVLQPLGEGEQIGITDRVRIAHDPRSFEHFALDQHEALTHVLRHFALHCINRSRVIDPTIAAHAMRVRDMDRGAKIAVECLYASESERILQWCEPRFGEVLCDKRENCGRLRQHSPFSHQGGYSSLRIDLQVLRLALLILTEIHRSDLIVGARLFQRDMGGERACVNRVKQFEHRCPSVEVSEVYPCWLAPSYGGAQPHGVPAKRAAARRKHVLYRHPRQRTWTTLCRGQCPHRPPRCPAGRLLYPVGRQGAKGRDACTPGVGGTQGGVAHFLQNGMDPSPSMDLRSARAHFDRAQHRPIRFTSSRLDSHGAVSPASKSNSTRAPLGSKQNNCHTPDSLWRRKSYLMPPPFSVFTVPGRSLALKAMWSSTP